MAENSNTTLSKHFEFALLNRLFQVRVQKQLLKCSDFHRSNIYKWLAAYREGGFEALSH